ncbi:MULTISPECIES: hypothetical protein [Yersinia]|uniref:hypothetical protein n=1 Tax=Yersinia TaxID=629 RepID=UPI0011A853E4|nr:MULTISPECIES: hypothetical protein [Yersinia]MBS0056925.1 hypothetical protein [Yersinia sp. Marseille-Q3913]
MKRQLAALLAVILSIPSAFAVDIPAMEKVMREGMQNPKTVEYRSITEVTNSTGETFVCGEVRITGENSQLTDFIPFAYTQHKTIYVSSDLSKNEKSEYRLTGCEGKELEASWYKTLTVLDTNCLAAFQTLNAYFSEEKSDEIAIATGVSVWDDFDKKTGKSVDAEFNKSAYYYLKSVLNYAKTKPELGAKIKVDPIATRNEFLTNCRSVIINEAIK